MSLYLGNTLLAGVATPLKIHNLFDFKWADYELTDQNWLRADTYSWQDGTVYSNAYNHLVADIDGKTATTETINGTTVTYYLADDGHKIVDVADVSAIETVYSSTGVAWYYILDTTNQRFKLPRENPAREELIQIIRAKGNGMSLGLQAGEYSSGVLSTRSNLGIEGFAINNGVSTVGVDSGTVINGNSQQSMMDQTNPRWCTLGVLTDSTKSGIISSMTDSTSVYKGKQYLYFYVGQFSQSAIEQTAGLNSELFNGKVDLDGSNATFKHIVETYHNGTEWYRIWSDGWCEQGGIAVQGSGGNVSVNLLKQFANTDYIIVSNLNSTGGTGSYNPVVCVSKTTSTFYLATWGDGTAGYNLGWRAFGYIS